MTTRWKEIARSLRDRIEDGTYPPGSKIPAIPELMDEWDVARDTVRDAVSRLANEGLVTPRRGIGTVVRDITPVALAYRPDRPAAVWTTQTEGGLDELISTEWATPDRGVIDRLEIPPNSQVVHRVRHQYSGKQVAQIMEQWVPDHVVTAIANATDVDLSAGPPATDLHSLLRHAKLPPASTTETLSTRMPDPDEADLMELPPGVPVLITVRVTRSDGPVETSTFVGAGDRMSQSFTVPLGG